MSQFFSQESHLNIQQSQRNSAIVVPLVKFSCSLTHQGSTTGSQWTHYSRNDLELVIQEVQVGSPQGQNESTSHFVMKVVAGAEYLVCPTYLDDAQFCNTLKEEQDLEDIARISKNFVPSPGIEIPVRVVIKQPLLALRYPKAHDVRRLQFRFRDDSGFGQIVNILTNLGLTTTDSVSSGPTRSSTVNSTSSGMVPSTPTTSYLSSSQNTDFKVPMRPDSASSTIQRSSSSYKSRSDNHLLSRPQSAMSISSFMPQSKPSLEPLKRAQSLYVSQIEIEPREIRTSNFVIPSSNNIPLNHDPYWNRVLLPKSEESQRGFSASPFFEPQAKDHLPNGSTSSSSVNGADNFRNNGYGTVLDSFSSTEYRPLSRPTEYPTFSALGKRPISLPTEHDICFGLSIPPKRQLPFSTVKEPLSTAAVPTIPEDVNLTVQAVNERKKPLEETFDTSPANEISTPTKIPTKRRIASRKGITHLPEVNDPPTRILPSISRSTSDRLGVPIGVAARQRPVSTSSNKVGTPKMVDSSTQTQTLSGRDHTAALKPMQTASGGEGSSSLPTAFEPPQILQHDLDLFVSRYSSRSRISLPPNYSDVPDDVRHKMLNDFIIENLENEDFLKLAEDMDASWRRIGLTR
ncbi:hypothetical protein NHQ30_000774 [Ciborinia camelliae]|nr:hypothetical protein NHQ30_000774 [Ciborinia camelliae]